MEFCSESSSWETRFLGSELLPIGVNSIVEKIREGLFSIELPVSISNAGKIDSKYIP